MNTTEYSRYHTAFYNMKIQIRDILGRLHKAQKIFIQDNVRFSIEDIFNDGVLIRYVDESGEVIPMKIPANVITDKNRRDYWVQHIFRPYQKKY